MFVELHMIQNFAPSNLNRDDTGAPKDCEFGGYRRARISSQCLKRAIRTEFKAQELLPAERLAERTKRVTDELARRLERAGRPKAEARSAAAALLRGIGLDFDTEGKTEYLLFLGEAEIARLAELCLANWDELTSIAGQQPAAVAASEAADTSAAAGGTRKKRKAAAKAALSNDIKNAALRLLDGGKAADVALFGRMLADLPEKNIDAASQVAHALSTNKVSMEFDFYTAVDDLRPEETEGADMLGTIEFNSACFYRYANVDLEQLRKNLGDEELARRAAEAFLRASVAAVPTGKQNSMAAHNPPSLVFAVVREHGLWNLANAFLTPVRPTGDGNLVQRSMRALDEYWGKLVGMYGAGGIAGSWMTTLDGDGLKNLSSAKVATVGDLVTNVLQSIRFRPAASNGHSGSQGAAGESSGTTDNVKNQPDQQP